MKHADLSFGPDVFAVNNAAARGHPLHFANVECAALIPVKDRAVENERHSFKTCMRVRTTNWPVANVKMIVHQQDKGIVHLEVFGRHDRRSQMSRTDESRCRWRHVNHATDTALLPHIFSLLKPISITSNAC